MITLKSHGFKFSRPEANFVFDVSYFKNPWRKEEIRIEKNSYKRRLQLLEFMEEQDGVKELVQGIANIAGAYETLFPHENIIFAICCSAGEYRSPAVVEMVGAELLKRGIKVDINHSENAKI